MSKILKVISLLLGVGLLFVIGYFIILMSAFGAFDKDYSLTELKDNFIKNEKEIYEVKNYFRSITSDTIKVHVEFEKDDHLGIFHVVKNNLYSNNWDLSINSDKADSLIRELGWSKENLKILKEKLDNANCISVSNEDNVTIGFQRSGMGMYSFMLFEHPIPDSLKSNFSDSCTYIFYNNKVVFEYEGGAVGPQCFYNF